MAPQIVHHLIPKTCKSAALCDERDFADVGFLFFLSDFFSDGEIILDYSRNRKEARSTGAYKNHRVSDLKEIDTG